MAVRWWPWLAIKLCPLAGQASDFSSLADERWILETLVSWAVSAFLWTSIAKTKVSRHPVSLIQCGPSSQFVFELVSRDCQPPLPLLLSLSFFLSVLLFYSHLTGVAAHSIAHGLWVAEAESLLLEGRHRQGRDQHYWCQLPLSERVPGMYREAGHYPANWQVCSIRVGRRSIRQICGSHFPVTKQLTHPDIHTLQSLFTLWMHASACIKHSTSQMCRSVCCVWAGSSFSEMS